MSGLYPPQQHLGASGSSVSMAEKQPYYYNNGESTAQLASNNGGAPGFYGQQNALPATPRPNPRRRKIIIASAVIGTLVVIGAVVGILFGAHIIKITTSSSSVTVSSLPDGSKTTVTNGVSPASSTGVPAAAASVTPLPQWDWTKSNMAAAANATTAKASYVQGPMVGAALGNWLILEQWMSESWFNTSAKNNASVIDEWNLMLALGSNAVSTMKAHYDTWVTEADIDTLHKAGVNMVRIPMGFWAFIDTIPGEPYLTNNQTGILTYVDRLLGWLYARKMYAMFDLHGMPGSQNGEITSGVHTLNPRFYQGPYLQRAQNTVTNCLKYITNSPYRSVVAGLGVLNEPRPYTVEQFGMIRSLYQQSYDTSMALANPVPIIFHHGFPNFVLNTSYIDYWQSFVANKTYGMIMLEDHPYPGTFPPSSDKASMLRGMCNYVSEYKKFGAPVVVTEWSLKTALFDHDWMRSFYQQQLYSWSSSSGGVFWNFKTNNGSIDGGNNTPYSMLDLLNQGVIPTPAAGQTPYQFIQGLGNPCSS